MRKKIAIILFIAVFLIIAGIAGFIALRVNEVKNTPDPKITAVKLLESLCSGDTRTANSLMESGSTGISEETSTEEGANMAELIRKSRSYSVTNSITTGFRQAEVDVELSCLDPEKLAGSIAGAVNAKLAEMVEAAAYTSDIYTSELTYKSDVVYAAVDSVLRQLGDDVGEYTSKAPVTLSMVYDGKEWKVKKNDMLRKVYSAFSPDENPEDLAQEVFEIASANPEYVRKHYTIAEGTVVAPEPDRNAFGVTYDPADIVELLDTPLAKQLIGEEKLAWSAETQLIPESAIRYYLDETILVLEWQEETARAVGTYTEVFIADGSQFRRKIVNDTFDANEYVVATELAAMTNSVFALSGDFYDLADRELGIMVYDRVVKRGEFQYADSCFITSNGDLIPVYKDQFSSVEEAQAFVDANDVVFSLCFGPVIIDNYEDKTPQVYIAGEIGDTYARCGIGQLGEHHYLTANINMRLYSQYVFLATLQDLTDAMMRYGCKTAYTLDGGQTAETIINNELINDVQFGEERAVSDIIYFATAVPKE